MALTRKRRLFTELMAGVTAAMRAHRRGRVKLRTWTTGKPAWNRKLRWPMRKHKGRIEVMVEPGRWVSRQRAWQLVKKWTPSTS